MARIKATGEEPVAVSQDDMAEQTPTPAALPAMSPDQFQQFLSTFAGTMHGKDAAIVEQIEKITEAVQKQRPENVEHPDVSARNPLGQRDHPNPLLPCKDVWFGGFPLHHEQLDRQELELLHQLVPGEYMVTRVDDKQETVRVGFVKDDTGQLSRISIGIKTGDEHKNAWPGLKRVLREIVSQIQAPVAAA
jgi:hypothetical protein